VTAGAGGLSFASRVRGCLLAGALGDALGAPTEFMKWPAIRAKWGEQGLTHFVPAYGVLGAITDDTQMTLFTVEGLIRAMVRYEAKGICHPPSVVHHAYRRWLATQGASWEEAGQGLHGDDHPGPDGWLIGERILRARRAPGNTCVSALQARGGLGDAANNDSKGCGGVMRAAPVGFLFGGDLSQPHQGTARAFAMSVEIAALTHGHPSGQLPAGVLAAMIHEIAYRGATLDDALATAHSLLREKPRYEETLAALEAAQELAGEGSPHAEKVESLGGGWVAEEALAIAVYAALSYPQGLRAALILAANHSGDTDSTAAICGNLLGAVLGEAALPADWLAELEGRDVIAQLANDFVRQLEGRAPGAETAFPRTAEADVWWERYPGW
jgi:ADP-ribosylglycohydrolase